MVEIWELYVCKWTLPGKQTIWMNFVDTASLSSMQRQVGSLTYPCPKCCHWFKNKSGLMQYLNVKHPVLTCPPSQTDEQQSISDRETELHGIGGYSPISSPAPDVETKFFSPEGKLYQNYHMTLNGKWSLLAAIHLTHSDSISQVTHVMCKGFFCLKVFPLLLFKRGQLMIGHLSKPD